MVYLLSKNKISIPIIGLGTRGKTTPTIICKAIEVGYRHIDTAINHCNEKEIGQGIKESKISRDEIFLTTKIDPRFIKNEDIHKTFDRSLNKLNMNYVDLLLIHQPVFHTCPGDLLNLLTDVKKIKKTRAIGVSNFNSYLLNKCINLGYKEILCNQVEYHPLLGQFDLLDYYIHFHL